jgi:hypothetical protein
MAGQVSGRRSIAAGVFIPNLLTGQIFENIPYDAQVDIALNQAAVDGTPALGIIAQVACDGDIVLQDVNEQNLQIKATSPIWPDDYTIQLACIAGSRLFMQIRNNSAATTHVCFYAVRISPL